MSCAKVFHIFSAEQTITRNIWPTVGLYSGLPSAPPAHSMHRAKRAAPAPAPTQGSRGMAGVVLGQLREQGALRRPVPEDPPLPSPHSPILSPRGPCGVEARRMWPVGGVCSLKVIGLCG